MNGIPIIRRREARYLGVITDDRWNFTAHIDAVAERSLVALHQLAGIGHRRFHLPPDLIRLYHNSILASIVGYGSPVWTHRLTRVVLAMAVRRVQRNILLHSVGAYRTTLAGHSWC